MYSVGMSLESQQQVAESLRKKLEAAISIDVSELVGTERHGTNLHFKEIEGFLLHITQLMNCLLNANLLSVPQQALSDISGHVDQLSSSLNQIKSFSAQRENPHQHRNHLISNLEEKWLRLLTSSAGLLGLLGATAKMQERSSLNDIETTAKAEAKRLNEEISKAAKEATDTLEKIKAASADAGVSQEGKHFSEEANGHWWFAFMWLLLSLGLSATLVGMTLYFYHYPSPIPNEANGQWILLQRVGAKILLLSVLSFLLVFCVRNYSTSRHNYIVNKHRCNALSTFETFVKGAGDADTKDAILKQAVRAVFSPQTSGYLRKEGDVSAAPLLEIVKQAKGN